MLAVYLLGAASYGVGLKVAHLQTIPTAELEAQNKAWRNQLSDRDAALKSEGDANATLKSANTTLATENNALHAQIATLTATAGEVPKLQAQLQMLRTDNGKLKPAVETLHGENSALKVENKTLSESRAAQQGQIASLTDRVGGFQHQLAKFRKEIHTLKNSLPESTANKSLRWQAAAQQAKDLPHVSKADNQPNNQSLWVNRHYLLTTLLELYSLNLDTLQLPIESMIEELCDCPRNPDAAAPLNLQLNAAAVEKIARLRHLVNGPMQ
jgi:regulator of replication initiation timing